MSEVLSKFSCGHIPEGDSCGLVVTLVEQNAKLRELVRDMFCGYKGAVEMLPPSYSKNVAERAVMDISDRMRELGVEVD